MSTLELRHKIIEQLSLIEDTSFLKAIKTIIEAKVAESEYKLSDFEKQRISQARTELLNGQTINNDVLQNEIDEWLSSK
ncbi:MAG: hypothetical protein JXR34_09490 [Bacteroidales bacterium]|nr:hypothetical protein [Bacteroidales bacterium]